MKVLIAIPVFNEAKYADGVLRRVLAVRDSLLDRHHVDVLAIDDGSTDATPSILAQHPIDVIRHGVNAGYGASLRDAFGWASGRGYDWLVTMDCDEQHEPAAIPRFLDEAQRGGADIISGSRYMPQSIAADAAPPQRRAVNITITKEVNDRLGGRLGTQLTDGFCGFKAYRVASLNRLRLTENGYAFPMQFWVQAAAFALAVREMPVKLIYNDPNRSFGATLDDPTVRLAHYRDVLHKELRKQARRLPASALIGVASPLVRAG
jgi:dolichol-phosphate mannosyltransferase